ncbi:hypothetical protein B0H14DRAFT_1417089 [Mycena olivaceomarginata]|nr:hypothetical protein B0H14DRAFT_1417089 [Mycena olivaceomarginata]
MVWLSSSFPCHTTVGCGIYIISDRCTTNIYISVGKLRVCLQSLRPLSQVYQMATTQISSFFAIVSGSVTRKNRYPSPAQVAEAKELGAIMAIWAIGSCRAYLAEDKDIYLGYHVKITPLRNDLRQKVRRLKTPALVPNYMEAQYAIAAYESRVAGLTTSDW